jgi:hypothetical protein
MLQKTVTYVDPFTDEKTSEVLYFNLSKAEVAELVLAGDDFGERLQAVAEKADPKELLATVKDIIRRSYGERVEMNGKAHFMKSPEISKNFMATEAYSAFFYELFTDPSATAEFINGIMPEELINAAKEQTLVKQPQDHRPKEIKTVELPREDGTPYFDKEVTEKSRTEMTLDELIALKKAEED